MVKEWRWNAVFVLAVSALQLCTSSDRSVQISGSNRSFSICDNRFVLQDGSHRGPVTVASGSMHYSRVPKAYWADRLQRMRALGLNSVQTCRDPTIHSPDGSPCAVQVCALGAAPASRANRRCVYGQPKSDRIHQRSPGPVNAGVASHRAIL